MAENKGSKTEFAVKLTLVFFISLLAFSVGTFVGKEFSDSEYRRASLEGELSIGRDTASTTGYEDNNTNQLSEEEIASLTDEFIDAEKKKLEAQPVDATGDYPVNTDHQDLEDTETSTHASSKSYRKFGDSKNAKAVPSKKLANKIEQEKNQVTAYKKKIAAKSQAADKVARNEAPTSGKPEVRNPSSVLPSVASSAVGKYTVQIASYASETEAKGHAAKLKEKGWNAFYIPAEVSGKTWFRVSVGLFNDTTSAKTFQEELTKEANITSSIVQKIVQ